MKLKNKFYVQSTSMAVLKQRLIVLITGILKFWPNDRCLICLNTAILLCEMNKKKAHALAPVSNSIWYTHSHIWFYLNGATWVRIYTKVDLKIETKYMISAAQRTTYFVVAKMLMFESKSFVKRLTVTECVSMWVLKLISNVKCDVLQEKMSFRGVWEKGALGK